VSGAAAALCLPLALNLRLSLSIMGRDVRQPIEILWRMRRPPTGATAVCQLLNDGPAFLIRVNYGDMPADEECFPSYSGALTRARERQARLAIEGWNAF
jgi:hypothetical protein